jgi:hypothetical protein
MKMKGTSLKTVTVAAFAAILIIMVALQDKSIGRVSAFNPQPDPPAFGAFGITHEQTARLGARVFVPESESSSQEGLRPVVIEFDFHDTQDNLIRTIVQTVEPGHAAFLDLNGAETPASDAIRSELQPCIKVLSNPNGDKTVQVIASLQTFDNSGPDAGKSRMGWTTNHNETFVRDTSPIN